jgi:type IV secretory pathway TraG/TraD family ATPase VirD4
MTTLHLGDGGPHPVVASAARELLNKSENERSGVLSTAMSFLGALPRPVVARVTRRCDWRIADLTAGDRPTTLYLAGHRLAPWLSHLMVSRQETPRPLLTAGEVVRLLSSDELVLMSGCPPIQAKKARYFEDRRLATRVRAQHRSPCRRRRPGKRWHRMDIPTQTGAGNLKVQRRPTMTFKKEHADAFRDLIARFESEAGAGAIVDAIAAALTKRKRAASRGRRLHPRLPLVDRVDAET